MGRLISTTPQLFQGILKIRIGSIIQAMRIYTGFSASQSPAQQPQIEQLSPSLVRKLMYKVLTDDGLDAIQKRQIEGALCRVPQDFYDKIWYVVRRLKGGILIQGQLVSSSTKHSTSAHYEMNFVMFVESILAKITSPQYRQLNVEVSSPVIESCATNANWNKYFTASNDHTPFAETESRTLLP